LDIEYFVDPSTIISLKKSLSSKGVGLDPEFGIPDGDITSVACKILLSAGESCDYEVLHAYESKNTRIFKTYPYERNASVSTNIHALEALQLMDYYPEQETVVENILVMLLNNREYNTYWTDKWHASPYYATSHALIALLHQGNYLGHACRHTVDWIVNTQLRDGSWGFFGRGTVEETAYALTALLYYHNYHPLNEEILHKGACYLLQSYEKKRSHPEFWIGKDLFIPYDVVQAAILAALILYQNTFGGIRS
jgi:squalene cyclase